MLFILFAVIFVSEQFQMAKSSKFQFSLLKNYYRSSKPVVGLKSVQHVKACEKFTIEVKGLAFNYSPFKQLSEQKIIPSKSENGTLFPRKANRKHILDQPEEFYQCHAIGCPEIGNLTSLISDHRFDYYTLYGNPVPPSNTTCVSEVGLFRFHKTSHNYYVAFKICFTRTEGALAHIVSEKRTNGLADLLRTNFENKNTKSRIAYVGLNYSWPEREFRTSEWENLRSFAYRAWAPGYPRKHGNQSCVAIRMDRSWITVDCEKPLPFICEVYTSV